MITADPSPVLPQSSKAMMLPGCLGPRVTCADSVDPPQCPAILPASLTSDVISAISCLEKSREWGVGAWLG